MQHAFGSVLGAPLTFLSQYHHTELCEGRGNSLDSRAHDVRHQNKFVFWGPNDVRLELRQDRLVDAVLRVPVGEDCLVVLEVKAVLSQLPVIINSF